VCSGGPAVCWAEDPLQAWSPKWLRDAGSMQPGRDAGSGDGCVLCYRPYSVQTDRCRERGL
jgi:hypothetical protein